MEISKRQQLWKFEDGKQRAVRGLGFSSDGKYIAAGTGGSIYFFEAFADENKVFECKNVIEPQPEVQRVDFGVVDQGSPEMIAKSRGKEPGLLEMIIDFIKNIFRSKSD